MHDIDCGMVVITAKKMHVLTMEPVDNGDHFVIVKGSEYSTPSLYTPKQQGFTKKVSKRHISKRKMAGIKAIHSMALKKILEEDLQNKTFEPSMKIYTGIDHYILVCNPTSKKLVFVDMTQLDGATFSLMEFDLPPGEELIDIDDYALHGNNLVLLINETIQLWRLNFDTRKPERTSHQIANVRLCSMAIIHQDEEKVYLAISQEQQFAYHSLEDLS
jgi:hypothetical protein